MNSISCLVETGAWKDSFHVKLFDDLTGEQLSSLSVDIRDKEIYTWAIDNFQMKQGYFTLMVKEAIAHAREVNMPYLIASAWTSGPEFTVLTNFGFSVLYTHKELVTLRLKLT